MICLRSRPVAIGSNSSLIAKISFVSTKNSGNKMLSSSKNFRKFKRSLKASKISRALWLKLMLSLVKNSHDGGKDSRICNLHRRRPSSLSTAMFIKLRLLPLRPRKRDWKSQRWVWVSICSMGRTIYQDLDFQSPPSKYRTWSWVLKLSNSSKRTNSYQETSLTSPQSNRDVSRVWACRGK